MVEIFSPLNKEIRYYCPHNSQISTFLKYMRKIRKYNILDSDLMDERKSRICSQDPKIHIFNCKIGKNKGE